MTVMRNWEPISEAGSTRVQQGFVNDPALIGVVQSFAERQLDVARESESIDEHTATIALELVRELCLLACNNRSPLISLELTLNTDRLHIDVENHRRGLPTCQPVLGHEPADAAAAFIAHRASKWDWKATDDCVHLWADVTLS